MVNASINFASMILVMLLFPLCYFSVREDLRERRISNRMLLFFFSAGFLIHAALFIYGLVLGDSEITSYVGKIAVNAIASLVAAYLLFAFNIWGPGDGKLFAVLGLFVPLQFYAGLMVPLFPASVLLVNIFIIGYLLILASSIAELLAHLAESDGNAMLARGFQRLKHAFQNGLARDMFLKFVTMLLLFLSIQMIMRIFLLTVGANAGVPPLIQTFFNIAAMLGASRYFMKLSGGKSLFVTMILVFLTLIALYSVVLKEQSAHVLPQFFYMAVFMMTIIPLTRYVILMSQKITMAVTVGDLAPDMALSEETTDLIKRVANLEVPPNIPLSKENHRKIVASIPAHTVVSKSSHLAFSVYIFIAVFFTLFFRQSVIHFLLNFHARR